MEPRCHCRVPKSGHSQLPISAGPATTHQASTNAQQMHPLRSATDDGHQPAPNVQGFVCSEHHRHVPARPYI